MNEEEREAQIEEMIYQELYGGGEEHKPLKGKSRIWIIGKCTDTKI